MALALEKVGVAVGGAGVEVFKVDLAGAAGARVILKNAGGQALGATVKVQVAKTLVSTDYADVDTTTFASLASAAIKTVAIPGPIEVLRLVADQGAGSTTVDASVSTSPDR
jgi:hypothetical protein